MLPSARSPKPAWSWRPIDPRVPPELADPSIQRLVAWFRQVRQQITAWNPALAASRDRAAAIAAGARPELFGRLIEQPVGTSHIADLHARATRNQSSVRAIRADGSAEFIPLRHGELKQVPNNPRRPDGAVHEYCPPDQVRGQMRALCAGYHQIGDAPLVKAAYLHHRLTQIHPFADGNGRTARLLASTPLVAAGLPPVSFPSDDREARYLPALRAADAGDLAPFVAYVRERLDAAIVGWHEIDAPVPATWPAIDERQTEYAALRGAWHERGHDLAMAPCETALEGALRPLLERLGLAVATVPVAAASGTWPIDPQVPGVVLRVSDSYTHLDVAVVGLGRPWTGAWLVGLTGPAAAWGGASPHLVLDLDTAEAAIHALDAPLRAVVHAWGLRR